MKKLRISGIAFALSLLIASCSKDKENNIVNTDCIIETITIDGDTYSVAINDGLITKFKTNTSPKEIISLNYNADNLLVSQVYQTDDAYDYFDTLIYNSQNKLIKYISYSTNPDGTSRTFEDQCALEYNSAGQIIKEIDSLSYEKEVQVYEFEYKNNLVSSSYSYKYNHTTKKHTERNKATFEYTNIKNNLLELYQLPSYLFLAAYYEAFNTEYLISKITENFLEDDSEEVTENVVFEYQYTLNQGNISSIIEIEDGFSYKLIDISYTCK